MIKKLERKVSTLQSELNAMKSRDESQDMSLKSEIDILLRDNKDLKQQVERVMSEKETCLQALGAMREEAKSLKQKLHEGKN